MYTLRAKCIVSLHKNNCFEQLKKDDLAARYLYHCWIIRIKGLVEPKKLQFLSVLRLGATIFKIFPFFPYIYFFFENV